MILNALTRNCQLVVRELQTHTHSVVSESSATPDDSGVSSSPCPIPALIHPRQYDFHKDHDEPLVLPPTHALTNDFHSYNVFVVYL